jgi:ribose transport system substrate-binding protein
VLLTRRDLLKATAVATGRRSSGQQRPMIVNSISTLESPTYSWWAEGGASFAKSRTQDLEYRILEHEGDFKKCLLQIKEMKRSTDVFCVVNLDLFQGFSARPLVDLCEQLQIYIVTQSGRHGLSDVDPWHRTKYYVAHLIHDQRQIGVATAEALMTAVGSRGRVVGLGGPLGDEAAEARRDGLDAVLNAHKQVELADFRPAEWEASSAYEVTRYWLSHFSDHIDGIWAANDRMALGAIEALRYRRLLGTVAVTGIDGFPPALESIRVGEMTATVPRDAYYAGGIGLSFGWQAFSKSIDVMSLPHNKREFNLRPSLVNKANVDRFLAYRQGADSDVDWDDLWVRSSDRALP